MMSEKKEQTPVAAAFGQVAELVIYAENPAAVAVAQQIAANLANQANVEVRRGPAPIRPGSYGK